MLFVMKYQDVLLFMKLNLVFNTKDVGLSDFFYSKPKEKNYGHLKLETRIFQDGTSVKMTKPKHGLFIVI